MDDITSSLKKKNLSAPGLLARVGSYLNFRSGNEGERKTGEEGRSWHEGRHSGDICTPLSVTLLKSPGQSWEKAEAGVSQRACVPQEKTPHKILSASGNLSGEFGNLDTDGPMMGGLLAYVCLLPSI